VFGENLKQFGHRYIPSVLANQVYSRSALRRG
jgi:hypothetical protein